jgi:hypothetical protein
LVSYAARCATCPATALPSDPPSSRATAMTPRAAPKCPVPRDRSATINGGMAGGRRRPGRAEALGAVVAPGVYGAFRFIARRHQP